MTDHYMGQSIEFGNIYSVISKKSALLLPPIISVLSDYMGLSIHSGGFYDPGDVPNIVFVVLTSI